MKKYIDRDEFVKRLNENVELTNPEEQEWVKDECIRQAHAMPSVNVSEWISVEERLPDLYGTYLVYTSHHTLKFGYFGEWIVEGEPSFDNYAVTHWMHLPEHPKP